MEVLEKSVEIEREIKEDIERQKPVKEAKRILENVGSWTNYRCG